MKLHKNFHVVIPKKDVERLKIDSAEYLDVEVEKNNRQMKFIVKPVIRQYGTIEFVMPEFCRDSLDIRVSDQFGISSIKSVSPSKKSKRIISDGNLDLLALIPEKMNNGKRIVIKDENKNIRLWASKCQEVKLLRFLSPEVVGKFFGMIQAESAKQGNVFEFGNVMMHEHKQFIELTKQVCPNLEWSCYAQFNPKTKREHMEENISKFSQITKISKENITPVKNHDEYGYPHFTICINNKLLNESLIGILINLRKHLTKKISSKEEKAIAINFLAKLLTGDGTVKIQRNKNWIGPYIYIYDRDESTLNEYKKIIENLGFKASVDPYDRAVRILTKWEYLFSLCKINLFEGHAKNRMKLIYGFLNHNKTKKRLASGDKEVFQLSSKLEKEFEILKREPLMEIHRGADFAKNSR